MSIQHIMILIAIWVCGGLFFHTLGWRNNDICGWIRWAPFAMLMGPITAFVVHSAQREAERKKPPQ